MQFNEKINLLMRELDANNAVIARYGGLDRTNVSRIRSGGRFPKASGKAAEKLINGIYLFADNKNGLETLCRITGGNPDGSADEIKDSIHAWLYDGIQGEPERRPGKRNDIPASFGERLDAVMTLADISNVRMSQLINVDSSLISRYRCGIRIPRSNPEMASRLSETLWQRMQSPEQMESLSKLMQMKKEGIDSDLFGRWLCDFGVDQEGNTATVEKLMAAFDSYSMAQGTLPELPDVEIEIPADEKDMYIGTTGLREAVVRFLGNAVKSGVKELWLYSDENMQWMTGDPEFQIKWVALMARCVRNNIKIRIIHNIDRGFDEMSDAIISWLPLYMSGMIEAYYCRKQGGSRFSHSLYICPGYACIESFHVAGTESEGIYHYYTEGALLDIAGKSYEKLLSFSASLVSVTEPKFRKSTGSGLVAIQNTLSVATMPEELVRSFDSKRLIEEWEYRRDTLMGNLKEYYVYECLPLADDEAIVSGNAAVESLPGTGKLYYTKEQYAQHVRHIVQMLKEYPNYRLYLLPDTPFHNMKIVLGSDFVTVTSSARPQFFISLTHPLMCAAFKEYTDNLRNNHKTDRNTLRKLLMDKVELW